jgi:hypothetical protein
MSKRRKFSAEFKRGAVERRVYCGGQPASRFSVTPARNLLNTIARGNRRRESVLLNQHRLLGEDTRHRALR